MVDIDKLKLNNFHIQSACEYLVKAQSMLQEINYFLDGKTSLETINQDSLVAELKKQIERVDEINELLKKVLEHKDKIEKCPERKKVSDKYSELLKLTEDVVKFLYSVIDQINISKIEESTVVEDLQGFFSLSVEQDREVSQNRAKEAEARAKEAEQKAIEATARQKEAEALKDVKKFEAEIVAEQNKKTNLELLDSIRTKDAQIVDQAREAIDIANQAMDKAIKAENIQKVKEQAEIIKHQSAEITKISGQQTRFTGYKKHKMFDGVFKDIQQNISPMLVGPAGSGKSTVLQQVADSMNLKYYPLSVNGQT